MEFGPLTQIIYKANEDNNSYKINYNNIIICSFNYFKFYYLNK
jgi:hypothetical protein